MRPTELKDGPTTGEVRAYEEMAGVHSKQITRADVGEYLVKVAADDATVGHTYLITE